MHAQVESKLVVQFDGQHMGSAGGEFPGDGAAAGADLDHRASGEIADGGRNALDGFSVDEEVLAELGFDGHGLL